MVAIKRPVCWPQVFIKPPPAAIDRLQKNALMQQTQKALCALFVVLKIGKSKPKRNETRPRNPCGKHYFAGNQINKTIPPPTNLKSLSIFVRFYIDETTNISDKLR